MYVCWLEWEGEGGDSPMKPHQVLMYSTGALSYTSYITEKQRCVPILPDPGARFAFEQRFQSALSRTGL